MLFSCGYENRGVIVDAKNDEEAAIASVEHLTRGGFLCTESVITHPFGEKLTEMQRYYLDKNGYCHHEG